MSKRKPGPEPKGDRVAFTVRIPRDHHEVLEQHLDQLGDKRIDYVARLIAQDLGLPEPWYLERAQTRDQRELPIVSSSGDDEEMAISA